MIDGRLYKELKPYSPEAKCSDEKKLTNIKQALEKSLLLILDRRYSDLGCLNVWAIRTQRDLHDIKDKVLKANNCFEIVEHLLKFHEKANRLFTSAHADVAQFLAQSLTALNSGITIKALFGFQTALIN